MLSVNIMSKRAHHKSKMANSHYFEKIENRHILANRNEIWQDDSK